MRKIEWTFVLGGTVASVIGGVVTVTDAIGGFPARLISTAVIRFAFGTTAGLPSTNRIRDGLADLGLRVDDLRYADEQPVSTALLNGTSTDGVPLFLAVLGRDAWSTRRLSRLWRRAWYHDEGSQHGSDRRQELEHEALVGFLASRAGVTVAELVTVGMSERDDAMLVTTRPDHTLADVGDDLLAAIWAEVGKFHAADLSHGALDARHVWLAADDTPAVMGSPTR